MPEIKGISFFGSGGLLYYYLGIAQFIQEGYDLEELHYKCVSGGCLPAVVLSTGLNVLELWENCFIPWIRDINEIENKVTNFLSPESMKILLERLNNFISLRTNTPEILSNINKRLSIRMTKITFFGTEQIYINEWDSLTDLLDCVVCSCWIPGIFGNLVKNYKGDMFIDGGFPKSIEDCGPDWLNIKVDIFHELSHELKLFLYVSSLSTLDNEKVARELYNLGYKDSQNNASYFNKLKKKNAS